MISPVYLIEVNLSVYRFCPKRQPEAGNIAAVVELGVGLDHLMVVNFGGTEVAPGWGHCAFAILGLALALGVLYGVKKALQALYKVI